MDRLFQKFSNLFEQSREVLGKDQFDTPVDISKLPPNYHHEENKQQRVGNSTFFRHYEISKMTDNHTGDMMFSEKSLTSVEQKEIYPKEEVSMQNTSIFAYLYLPDLGCLYMYCTCLCVRGKECVEETGSVMLEELYCRSKLSVRKYLLVMMDHAYNNTLENRAVVQLTAVLSTDTMPRDSIGISSKNIILNAGQYSEEHVLKCTFKACDPEETGQVSVFHIIEYLQEMTGQSCEDWRLQSLYKRLDPEEQGLTVDFSTFYSVMKDWIADCQQEGEEATDLTNHIKDLYHDNKQLAMQNVKLQRTIEAAEELNSRLSEEISQLKGKLRGLYYSNQQTLEQAKVLANELEDLNFFSKSMEEENNRLHIQARQLEKEQQFLSVKMDNLQDENKKLLLEKESSEGKIKKLFTKKAKMKSQLSEYENHISCKDAALNKKTKQIEELTITLDEYQMMVQELKLEVSRLQEHLCQSYQDLKMSPTDSLQNMNGSIQTSAQSLYKEIEESRREISRECGLPSPLCGMLNSLVIHPVAEGSIDSLTEQKHSKNGSDVTKASLPVSHNMPHLSFATDGKLISKNQEHKQDRNHLLSEKGGSKEESKQNLTNEHTGNSKTLELTLKNMDVWTYPSNIESQSRSQSSSHEHTPPPEMLFVDGGERETLEVVGDRETSSENGPLRDLAASPACRDAERSRVERGGRPACKHDAHPVETGAGVYDSMGLPGVKHERRHPPPTWAAWGKGRFHPISQPYPSLPSSSEVIAGSVLRGKASPAEEYVRERRTDSETEIEVMDSLLCYEAGSSVRAYSRINKDMDNILVDAQQTQVANQELLVHHVSLDLCPQ
ncbi:uncharacterized protein LOC114922225 [Protobothrops mucrosquamatus]|uniref:uncharacterized protein LOC114922225 n=1 Tax=Protobothrops mucrosquamatus TaxID=103944 RepID=UPI0010FBB136|nr:uncharacterized protein LOC114922225 [Protobothrops mucrosquamatus]